VRLIGIEQEPGSKSGSELWPVTRPDPDPNCWPGDPVTRDPETRFHLCYPLQAGLTTRYTRCGMSMWKGRYIADGLSARGSSFLAACVPNPSTICVFYCNVDRKRWSDNAIVDRRTLFTGSWSNSRLLRRTKK